MYFLFIGMVNVQTQMAKLLCEAAAGLKVFGW